MIGRKLGHYTILEKLGAGGMGEVYRAEDSTLEREVALKILPAELASNREFLDRFRQEARVLATLDHPNIVTVFTVEKAEDIHFLTMQLVEGQRLSEMIPAGGMSLERLLDIAIPLTEALQAAHHKGITHRDLKPANVMVSGTGRVKILDFGLAKLRSEVEPTVTAEAPTELFTGEGRILGTVPYMSPEQARGEDLDPRTDLFSFGVVLYEMATGSQPFTGRTPAAIFDGILRQPPAPIDHGNPELPDDLQHIVDKALEKDRNLRYHSADELLSDLRRLARDTDSTSAAAAVGTDARKPARRSWRKIAIGAAVVVLALAALWSSGLLRTSSRSAGPAVAVDQERSIAVLPFDNLSGDPEQDYFSDGLSIEMIAQLSKISSLDKVIAFNSSRRYRDSDKTVVEIGEELGAALLLEGTVRQQGEQVRVTVQLVDAREQGQLWAETYDGELSDIFAVQSRIADQIAAALRVELSPELRAQIERRPTENLTAYSLYLKGQDFRIRYNKEANQRAIESYRAAVELDPSFAQARAGLAYASALQGYLYGGEARWLDAAINEAKTALAIEPDLADAHVALAAAYNIRGRIEVAEQHAKKAIESSPNSDRGAVELGWVYVSTGRWDEAYTQFRKALDLNPLHSYNYWSMGILHLALGELDQAEKWAQRALQLQPDDTTGHLILWTVFLAQGRLEEAADVGQTMLVLSPEDPKSHMTTGTSALISGDLARAREHYRTAYELAPETLLGDQRFATSFGAFLWQTGERAQAEELFAQSLQLNEEEITAGNRSSRPLTDTAFIHATRGETAEALRSLRLAVDAGYTALNHPAWMILHADPEFQQMKAEVDAHLDVMRQRVAVLAAEQGQVSALPDES